MANFTKIDNYYIGAVDNGIYLFMQIETLGEIYQIENEINLIEAFNGEDFDTQVNMCDDLERDFLLYQNRSDLTALRIELIDKYYNH